MRRGLSRDGWNEHKPDDHGRDWWLSSFRLLASSEASFWIPAHPRVWVLFRHQNTSWSRFQGKLVGGEDHARGVLVFFHFSCFGSKTHLGTFEIVHLHGTLGAGKALGGGHDEARGGLHTHFLFVFFSPFRILTNTPSLCPSGVRRVELFGSCRAAGRA